MRALASQNGSLNAGGQTLPADRASPNPRYQVQQQYPGFATGRIKLESRAYLLEGSGGLAAAKEQLGQVEMSDEEIRLAT